MSIKRERQNKIFKGIAKKAKSSVGWFYSFKLHLAINDYVMAFKLTAGNVDDRKLAPNLVTSLVVKLFGDKSYISQDLFEKLLGKRIKLYTLLKKKMKNKLISVMDKILLCKRYRLIYYA